jgi:hypothetical protein
MGPTLPYLLQGKLVSNPNSFPFGILSMSQSGNDVIYHCLTTIWRDVKLSINLACNKLEVEATAFCKQKTAIG